MSLLLQDGTNLLLQDGTNLLLQSGSPPVFTLDPIDVTVIDGQNAVFSCLATGDPTITYQWYEAPSTPLGGETGTTLTIATVIGDDGKQYFCRATNPNGSTDSATATLTVNKQSLTYATQPADQTVIEGNSVTFTADVTGKPTLTYQWYEVGVGALSGETGTSLTFSTVIGDDGRQFYLITTDGYSDTLQSNTVTLTITGLEGEEPQLLKIKTPTGQWIPLRRNVVQYGGVRLDTPTALSNIVASTYQAVPFDAGALNTPRGISQDFANNGIRFTVAGVYRLSVYFVLTHDISTSAARYFDVRLYNNTDAVVEGITQTGVGRNDEVTTFMVSLLVEIGDTDLGDLYQLEIGNASATISTVTCERARLETNAVSEWFT